MPDGLHTIGYMAFEGTRVRSVILPEGVTCIEEAAFYGCRSLNYIVFPTSLKTVKKHAFVECLYLTEVAVPKSCRVAKEAFPASVKITRF